MTRPLDTDEGPPKGPEALGEPEALDAAVCQVLSRAKGGMSPLTVATALGLEAAGSSDPAARRTYERVEDSLGRVALRGRFGEWHPRRPASPPATREPAFRLELLGAIWTRCNLDKPARPADLASEHASHLDQLRDGVWLLELTGQIQLVTGRRSSRYVTTDRAAVGEYKAAGRVLEHVRKMLEGHAPVGAVELAGMLTVTEDTAEALLRGLQGVRRG